MGKYFNNINDLQELRKQYKELLKKYYELGFDVEDTPPPKDVKDLNEWLVKNKGKSVGCDEKFIPKR